MLEYNELRIFDLLRVTTYSFHIGTETTNIPSIRLYM